MTNLVDVTNEPIVEINGPQKGSKLGNVGWCRNGGDGLELFWIRPGAFAVDYVPQVFDFSLEKVAFLQLDVKTIFF